MKAQVKFKACIVLIKYIIILKMVLLQTIITIKFVYWSKIQHLIKGEKNYLSF